MNSACNIGDWNIPIFINDAVPEDDIVPLDRNGEPLPTGSEAVAVRALMMSRKAFERLLAEYS